MKLLITSTLTKNTEENSGFKFGEWMSEYFEHIRGLVIRS